MVELDGAVGAADHRDGGGEQPVVGSDEHRLAVADLDGDGAPIGADAGIDHREHDARREVLRAAGEREAAAANVVGLDLVREVDDGDLGGDRADHRLHDADELVGEAVVGQEGDRVVPAAHRRDDGTGGGPDGAYPACVYWLAMKASRSSSRTRYDLPTRTASSRRP